MNNQKIVTLEVLQQWIYVSYSIIDSVTRCKWFRVRYKFILGDL